MKAHIAVDAATELTEKVVTTAANEYDLNAADRLITAPVEIVFANAGYREAECVASKYHKVFMADLKPVYRAVSKAAAEITLDELEASQGQQYPMVIQSWRLKWDNLSAYFRYSADILKVIYTTNAIESVHRQIRKLTKTKDAFPNENSLLKLLYLELFNAQKKWTMPIYNWNLILSQLAIYFD